MVITGAIAVHSIPEGRAISLVVRSRRRPLWKAAGSSIFPSLPQPLLALPAVLFVPVHPIGIGLAAGAMIRMVFVLLIPDARHDTSGSMGEPRLHSRLLSSLPFKTSCFTSSDQCGDPPYAFAPVEWWRSCQVTRSSSSYNLQSVAKQAVNRRINYVSLIR